MDAFKEGFIVCIRVFVCMDVCAAHVCLVPMEAKEDVKSLGAGDACDCRMLYGCLE